MAEIRHTPLPTAVWLGVGDHEEVELICRECDINVHAEGTDLRGLRTLLGRAHVARHEALEATHE